MIFFESLSSNIFLYFICYLVICLIILFLSCILVIQVVKYVLKQLIGYDIITNIDNGFRHCQNTTTYDLMSQYYVLDYEYFDIIEMVYFHDNFLEPEMFGKDSHFYWDFMYETRVREDDDHDLYHFMSSYIVPLQHQYYLLEHYWPEADKVSRIKPNFYNFKDLEGEFKFIYQDYKILWPNYLKYKSSREIIYTNKLYDSKILQYYFTDICYDTNRELWYKSPLTFDLLSISKRPFWKKEDRTFDLIEPNLELYFNDYMTWFLLKEKYDIAKFEYDAFCGCSPYERFDSNIFDIFVNPQSNLIDLQTKRFHFFEDLEEYTFDFYNNQNLLNYYYDINFFDDHQRELAKDFFFDRDYDQPNDPYDEMHFFFSDRLIILNISILYFLYFLYFCLFLFGFYYCFTYLFSFFEFNGSVIGIIRLLTRHRSLHCYDDYKNLYYIFDQSETGKKLIYKNYNIQNGVDKLMTFNSWARKNIYNYIAEKAYSDLKEAKRREYSIGFKLFNHPPKHIFFMSDWMKKHYPNLPRHFTLRKPKQWHLDTPDFMIKMGETLDPVGKKLRKKYETKLWTRYRWKYHPQGYYDFFRPIKFKIT